MRIQIESNGSTMSGRAAIAAEYPGKLRIEWLSVVGQPLFRMTADGQTISVLRMEDQKIYHIKQSPTALASIIHLPLGVEDFLDILLGRPPLPEFEATQLSPNLNQHCAVVLKDRWGNPLADLQSDACQQIQSMKYLSVDEKSQYTVYWDAWQTIQEHTLPRQVRLISGNGDHISISVERMWPGVDIPQSTFNLTPAGD